MRVVDLPTTSQIPVRKDDFLFLHKRPYKPQQPNYALSVFHFNLTVRIAGLGFSLLLCLAPSYVAKCMHGLVYFLSSKQAGKPSA